MVAATSAVQVGKVNEGMMAEGEVWKKEKQTISISASLCILHGSMRREEKNLKVLNSQPCCAIVELFSSSLPTTSRKKRAEMENKFQFSLLLYIPPVFYSSLQQQDENDSWTENEEHKKIPSSSAVVSRNELFFLYPV